MVSYKALLRVAAIAPSWLLCSVALFGCALFATTRWTRGTLFLFFLLTVFRSFVSSHSSFLLSPGLANLWRQSLLVYAVHIYSLLYLSSAEPIAIKQPASQTRWSGLFGQAYQVYKLCWNTRKIPARPIHERTASRVPCDQIHKYLLFYILNFAKLIIYYTIHFRLLPALFNETIVEIQPEDVMPEQATLLLPLTSLNPREALVRAYISYYWIWESVVYVDGAHKILALAFVTAGLDAPEEWPELYGDLRCAVGLRKFWSGFWHGIVVRPYKSIAFTVTTRLCGHERGNAGTRTLAALCVFLLSGLSHAFVGWYSGHEAWERNVWWFMLNFGACGVETGILAATRGLADNVPWAREILRSVGDSWLGDFIGYVWVLAFLFWSVPMWRFLQEHKQAIAMERIRRLFSNMSIVY